jgi:Icc-related predicted phosphoesterase
MKNSPISRVEPPFPLSFNTKRPAIAAIASQTEKIMMKIFFATDVHGSDICWRKLVSAGKFYKANVVILGGDMTGKEVVPLIKQQDGTISSNFLGIATTLRGQEELDTHVKRIKDTGYYPFHTTPEEIAELSRNQEKANKVFRNLMTQRIREWIDIAERNLKGSGIRFIVAPGNDDNPVIDPMLDASVVIERAEGKVLEIEGHEMLNSGYTNPTPWSTPRECSEDELRKKIEGMISQIKDFKSCIFQLHAPPYGSGLDDAPVLDKDLRPIKGGTVRGPAGSTAVLEAIEKCQPLLGLHGHIHESKGSRKIGRTLCVNPGSMYSEGILQGSLIELDKDKIKSDVFTSG